jgi:hypothetical protein
MTPCGATVGSGDMTVYVTCLTKVRIGETIVTRSI